MTPRIPLVSATPRVAAAALIALALGTTLGCQSYERQPLDVGAVREAWLARSPEHEHVRAFAARLAGASGAEPGTPAFDPSDGLSLAEGEVIALIFNPDLRQARHEAGVATAQATFAGLWDDPVLGVDMERIVRGAGGANSWVVGGTVGLSIPLSGRLEAAKARAGAHAAAELDRVAAREWATRAALRELWIEWSAARMRAEIGRALVARLNDVATLADRQEQAGSMSRLDARLFRVELAGREADLIALDGNVAELELQLRGMLGLAPAAPVALTPSVAFAGPTQLDEAALLSPMEDASPELAAVRSQYAVAEHALRAEVRAQYPDLVIGPGYATDQGDDRVLLGVQLPLPLWNRNRLGIAEASAERDAARGRFETTYEHLATRLAIALVRYRSGTRQREAIESTVAPLADEQEADVWRVAGLGRVEPLLLLESLQTQHAAKVRLVDARAAEAIGAVRVAELIGPTDGLAARAEPCTPAPHNSPASAPIP